MTPTASGRHCAACQKTVVDFTQKTDAEILAYLRQGTGQACGRLRADQVNRPLAAPALAPRWRTWLGAVLAAGSVLGAGRATAQVSATYYSGGPVPPASPTGSAAPGQPARAVAAAPALPEANTSGGLTVLRGVVRDFTTHEGLAGVMVLLKGTATGTATDASGAFALPVEASATPAQLVLSSVGYMTQEQMATAGQPLAVVMAADVKGLMGEVVVAGSITLQRLGPWHPRRFFNWSKYWLAKPFRRK